MAAVLGRHPDISDTHRFVQALRQRLRANTQSTVPVDVAPRKGGKEGAPPEDRFSHSAAPRADSGRWTSRHSLGDIP